MEQSFAALFSSLPGELTAALVIYLAGYATSRLFSRLNHKHQITVLHHRTETAFKAIEMAEQKYPGPGNGPKKLEYATHELMESAKLKKYEDAQNLILQCFPLTKLNHT
ncbi:MAG: hypothetical protein A3F04_00165 [Candidatus Chisholmbacteria bacterium RIFCSPHIGHO2_12_FULL_49_9]|uniref:Uncharacterized protein n=1 Tax=Candidatus Chisholmbacteria bacterium RIFCSPHIGHO2_01_FULL_52_32 TaxID=1797591 RepID=A0A1G1VS96_9BACT|nr:MAG: hypothetical protein A2786_02005 [Candidatus Chisholmbacteria bacterium RIFCSPHIGHO2_01_FULL_52_32]OGY19130.1 MAG: hypothetical protein A3F04_00165 [Candidatus Chisholmbacteria bacterium RIFCSPHIGHO2_12_FULL_49_9]OGY20354.1 MAG: hypothetical protein A2900_04740 [Candidatus Chisholmbacteria bacterium RIFCSPLOWO2_01_FULL_50_28]